MATIRERLEEFYRRLGQLPRAANAEDALGEVCRMLDEVEDQLSGIVRKSPPPPPTMPDGRMYPPQDDFITRHADDRIEAETRRHRIEIDADGAVTIIHKTSGTVEFRK